METCRAARLDFGVLDWIDDARHETIAVRLSVGKEFKRHFER
jgi:hypothetical protein